VSVPLYTSQITHGLGLNPSLCGVRPAINSLRHGAAQTELLQS